MANKLVLKKQLSDENYVDQAESVIKELYDREKENKRNKLVTTSQLRNILAMVMDIYNQVISEKDEELDGKIIGRIQYLKVKMIYDAGKEASVKTFLNQSGLLHYVDHINGSRKNYILFTRYMEALVAYRKYVGGDKEIG